jgi:hypothetical protein
MNIDEMKEEALRIVLESLFLSARFKRFPNDYSGAAPRRKTAGARGRKRALYASMTGVKKIRFGRFNRYTRLA